MRKKPRTKNNPKKISSSREVGEVGRSGGRGGGEVGSLGSLGASGGGQQSRRRGLYIHMYVPDVERKRGSGEEW